MVNSWIIVVIFGLTYYFLTAENTYKTSASCILWLRNCVSLSSYIQDTYNARIHISLSILFPRIPFLMLMY